MRAAIIGLGMVADTHVRALVDSEKAELYGVCARDTERSEAFANSVAEQHGSRPKVFRDAKEIAASDDVDFVILATPPDARIEIIRALADAGKPILMEKPIERDFHGAKEIVEYCENRVPLGIVFQHRMREASRRLAEMLQAGDLGEIKIVEISVPWWRDQSYYDAPGRGTYARDGGGVMISQAIHSLDLALSFAGPVQTVQAFARTSALHQLEAEDFVMAGLEFKSGAIGSFFASTACFPGGSECLILRCSKASATLEAGTLTIQWHDGTKKTFGTNSGTGSGADPMAFTHAWHQSIIEDFVDALQSRRVPIATGSEALKVHALIAALAESSKLGRTVEVRND